MKTRSGPYAVRNGIFGGKRTVAYGNDTGDLPLDGGVKAVPVSCGAAGYGETGKCERITLSFSTRGRTGHGHLGHEAAPARRRRIAVAVAAGGTSIARAGGPPAHAEFVLTETTTGRASVDVDGSGTSSPGDAFIFHSMLMNGSGATVGTVNGHCVVLLGGRNLCHSVVSLARGALSTTFVASAGSATLAISIDGGTGRYDRTRGQITATRATQTAFREEFDIDR